MDGTQRQRSSASSISASVGAPKESAREAASCTASTTAGWPCPASIGPRSRRSRCSACRPRPIDEDRKRARRKPACHRRRETRAPASSRRRDAPLGALEKLCTLLHLKRLRYWLARAAMSGASKRSLMTARRSAPARTSVGAFWTVMPPIAQRGTPRSCASSAARAPRRLGRRRIHAAKAM